MLSILVKWLYPQYHRPKSGYMSPAQVLWRYAFWQKVLRINGNVPWPVHFTSKVHCPENITKGRDCDPGDNYGVYINAKNGIRFGSRIEIGPGAKILSVNHDLHDLYQSVEAPPIVIEDGVWIGANAVILPGVHIGEGSIIGAGAVVTKDVPAGVVAAGNPCRVIREK
jgi:acetyltransferase-like isoleucine patch superfamily enzyme